MLVRGSTSSLFGSSMGPRRKCGVGPLAVIHAAMILAMLFTCPTWTAAAGKNSTCVPPMVNEAVLRDGSNCTMLRKTCLDQETYIVFDEEYRKGFKDLPSFQMDDMMFLLPHKLLPGQEPGKVPNPAKYHEHMRGHAEHYINPVIRLPAVHEEGFEPADLSYFSNCTVPLIGYQEWSSTLAEFMARQVPNVWGLWQSKAIDENITFVIANPSKGGITSFNSFLLHPFTKHAVQSFATFSSRLPSSHLSNATAERRHIRCFERVFVCKFDGRYAGMNDVGTYVSNFYRSKAPKVDKFWRAGSHILHVLFEVRRLKNFRQILNLKEVLKWCNSGKIKFPAGSNFTEMQCISHMWGNDHYADMAVANGTDVMVAAHGSGEANAVFMKHFRHLIELRPYLFGTKHDFTPKMWWPFIVYQNQFKNMYWAINLEDPALYTKAVSVDDEKGGDRNIVKERNVILPVAVLEMVLKKIGSIGFDRDKYWPEWEANKVVFNYHSNGTMWHSATINENVKYAKSW